MWAEHKMEEEREQLSQILPQSISQVSYSSPWCSPCETPSVSPYGFLAEDGMFLSPIHESRINNIYVVVSNVSVVPCVFQKHAS